MRSENTVIIGITSAIGRAIACAQAERGGSLVIAARCVEEAEREAADLELRYRVSVRALSVDLLDPASIDVFVSCSLEALDGQLDRLVIASGYMDEQETAQKDAKIIQRTVDTNLTGVMQLTERFAAYFAEHGSGTIAVVSSVAGDRGRMSNYIYGCAKAGLSAYLQGLRNRMWHHGVHVATIKPGFVDTQMTWGVVDSPLMASPDAVGHAIVRALDKKRREVYVPGFWRYIMGIIKAIPEPIFNRLRL